MSGDRGWGANFLLYERAVGLLAGAAIAAWSELFGGSSDIECFLDGNAKALYTVVAPMNVALLGFILAAAAIIVTAAPAKKLTLLRESAHYDDLWETFRSALRFLGAGAVLALIGLVTTDDTASRIIFFLALTTWVVAILRVARSVWAVSWVIRIFTGPSLERKAGS